MHLQELILTRNDNSRFSPPQISIWLSYKPISRKYWRSIAKRPPAMVGDLFLHIKSRQLLIYDHDRNDESGLTYPHYLNSKSILVLKSNLTIDLSGSMRDLRLFCSSGGANLHLNFIFQLNTPRISPPEPARYWNVSSWITSISGQTTTVRFW